MEKAQYIIVKLKAILQWIVRRVYSLWYGVNFIVYTDGSYDKVDVGKFTIVNIGDTVSEKYYR